MRGITSWRNPNYWTVTRIFCALLIGSLLRNARPFDSITAYGLVFLIFVVTALTDIMDGYLARTYDFKTKLGAFLDTLADKLLYLIPLWFFRGQIGVGIFWATLVIESSLMLQRIIKLARGNKAIEANKWGKTKAWCQCSAIAGILLANFLAIQILVAFSIFAAIAGLIFSIMSLATQVLGFLKSRN